MRLKKKDHVRGLADKLLHSEKMFRSLFNNAPQPICIFLPDKKARAGARFLALNAAARRKYGISVEEAEGLDVAEILPAKQPDGADSAEMVCGMIAQAQEKKVLFHTHVRLRRGNGSEWDAECSAHAIEFDGRTLVVVSQKDISDRIRGETALRESAERFRRLFSQAPLCIAIVDLEGRFLQANPPYCRLLGYTEVELIGTRFADLTHPDDAPNNLAATQSLLKGELRLYKTEKRYIRKDGEVVLVELRASLLFDAAGKPRNFLVIAEDIRGLRKAQADLRESEERFRSLFEQSPMGIVILTKDMRLAQVNPAFARMLGYSVEELQGMKMPDITHHKNAKIDRTQTQKVFRGEIPYYQTEKRYIRKDSQLRRSVR